MRRRHLTRMLVAALAAASASGGAAIPAAAVGVRLSDETTTTRWAHPLRGAPVRAEPRATAAVVARLRTRTEDGRPEVSLLLRRLHDRAGQEWIQVRVAGRPNGRTGWVLRGALGRMRTVHTQLVVDQRRLRVVLRRRGRVVWSAPIGVGASATPTPTGHYWVREILRVAPGAPMYGPYAIGTSAYSVLSDWPGGGVVGLHGTNRPELVPGRPSHGCIRLRNADITHLVHKQRLPLGTPIEIR